MNHDENAHASRTLCLSLTLVSRRRSSLDTTESLSQMQRSRLDCELGIRYTPKKHTRLCPPRMRRRPPVQTLGFSCVSRATSCLMPPRRLLARNHRQHARAHLWCARAAGRGDRHGSGARPALTSPAEHMYPLPPESERAPVRLEGRRRRVGGGTHVRLLGAHGPSTCQPATCQPTTCQPATAQDDASTANQTATTKAQVA